MAGTTTVAAQSTFANVQEAISQLEKLVDNPLILERGQFAWADMYALELKARVVSVIPPGHGLYPQIVGPSLEGPLLDRMLVACVARSQSDYGNIHGTMTSIVDAYLKAHPADSGALWLQRLLKPPSQLKIDELAVTSHDNAVGYFSQGHNFKPDSSERIHYFCDKLHGFLACFKIYNRAQERCSTLAVNMGLYLYSKHWRNDQHIHQDKKQDRKPLYVRSNIDHDDHFEKKNATSGYGQIIGFRTELKNVVTIARDALNRGYLFTANVISGTRKDHGAPNVESEHSITIIGHDVHHDQVTFAFWDPDSTVSFGEFKKYGFGLLYYDDAARCKGGVRPDQHKHGRLTTAESESDLVVDVDGDHRSKTQRHRYQVVGLEYIR